MAFGNGVQRFCTRRAGLISSVALLATAPLATTPLAAAPNAGSSLNKGTTPGPGVATSLSTTQNSPGSAALGPLLITNSLPYNITLKELSPDWRRFSLSDEPSTAMPYRRIKIMLPKRVYYTRGALVSNAGQTYLVAYRLVPTDEELEAAIEAYKHGETETPPPSKPMPGTKLALSLLNLRTAGHINDISHFDPRRDMAGVAEINALSMRNLRLLGQLLRAYINVNDTMPPMKTAAATHQALEEYIEYMDDDGFTRAIFVHPETGAPYTVNPALHLRDIDTISKPEKVVAFYEAAPASDGTRGVLYVSGKTARVPVADWARVKKSSGLP